MVDQNSFIGGLIALVAIVVGFYGTRLRVQIAKEGELALPKSLRKAYDVLGDDHVKEALREGAKMYEENADNPDVEDIARKAASAYLHKVAESKGFIIPDSFINAIIELAVAGITATCRGVAKRL